MRLAGVPRRHGPVAAAIRMLLEELRVELPGESVDDAALRVRDALAENEDERRTEGIPVERAAAIAVEISEERIHAEADASPERSGPL